MLDYESGMGSTFAGILISNDYSSIGVLQKMSFLWFSTSELLELDDDILKAFSLTGRKSWLPVGTSCIVLNSFKTLSYSREAF